MNNPFMFGVGPGHLNHKKVAKILRDIGETDVELINGYTDGGTPSTGRPQHWFAKPNAMGEPFDSITARNVLAIIKAAGGCYARGSEPHDRYVAYRCYTYGPDSAREIWAKARTKKEIEDHARRGRRAGLVIEIERNR